MIPESTANSKHGSYTLSQFFSYLNIVTMNVEKQKYKYVKIHLNDSKTNH